MKKFGVSQRVSYDSSDFYSRKIFSGKVGPKEDTAESESNAVPPDVLDRVHCADSRRMHQIPDSSIHLMVTSPPYNVGKEYDKDLSIGQYRNLLKCVFRETRRVLVSGGRACINVANLGRKPYIPLHALIIEEMTNLGFLMRGEIIWDKSASAGVSTAWGSWQSAANPILRDVHEYILVFSKDTFQRRKVNNKSTVTKQEFLEYTKSIWKFPAESARKVAHPAPFPVELPYRLIQLYTFEGDTVLDPFSGSGSTCIAALMSKRHYTGFDISRRYVQISRRRIREFLSGQCLPV